MAEHHDEAPQSEDFSEHAFVGNEFIFETRFHAPSHPSDKKKPFLSTRVHSKTKAKEAKVLKWKAKKKAERKKKAKRKKGHRHSNSNPDASSLIDEPAVIEPVEVTTEIGDLFESDKFLKSERYLEVKEKVLASLEKFHIPIVHTRDEETLEDKIADALADDETFSLVDLTTVIKKYLTWTKHLPRIEPFYATKCNPDPMIVTTVTTCGAGMDCASKAELELAIETGVDPNKIIFAHPCKMPAHLNFAKKHNVKMMTFDNEEELQKIKKIYPEAELVLRILGDDSHSTMRFGSKFGANVDTEAEQLLNVAFDLGLNVIGVSFHVGSGCQDAIAYRNSLNLAKKVFDMAEARGHPMRLVDIGGGMPGVDLDDLNFPEVASAVAAAVNDVFPDPNIRVIAEPGRYFAAECTVLVTSVVSKRVRKIQGESPDSDERIVQYYISDGVYGSFNSIFFDHAAPTPNALPRHKASNPKLHEPHAAFGSAQPVAPTTESADGAHPDGHDKSIVFGPTCDSIDLICKDIELPDLEVGDFIYFFNMGAYTTAAGSTFNGFERPRPTYMIS